METAQQFIQRRSDVFQKNLDKYRKNPKDCYLKWFPDINRKGKWGYIKEKWTFMIQSNLEEKIFIVEKFVLKKILKPVSHPLIKLGEVEIRIGYYMLGKNGNRIDKWTWGESCPIIPKKDLNKLINKARKDGTTL